MLAKRLNIQYDRPLKTDCTSITTSEDGDVQKWAQVGQAYH